MATDTVVAAMCKLLDVAIVYSARTDGGLVWIRMFDSSTGRFFDVPVAPEHICWVDDDDD